MAGKDIYRTMVRAETERHELKIDQECCACTKKFSQASPGGEEGNCPVGLFHWCVLHAHPRSEIDEAGGEGFYLQHGCCYCAVLSPLAPFYQ
jgi:hypothetical protein